MKKNAMRARIPPASTVSPQRNRGSARRARGGRSSSERPPLPAEVTVAASTTWSALDRGPVAGEAVHGLLGLGVDRPRQLGVLELGQRVLARAPDRVVEEVLQPLGDALARPGLARVLVDD